MRWLLNKSAPQALAAWMLATSIVLPIYSWTASYYLAIIGTCLYILSHVYFKRTLIYAGIGATLVLPFLLPLTFLNGLPAPFKLSLTVGMWASVLALMIAWQRRHRIRATD